MVPDLCEPRMSAAAARACTLMLHCTQAESVPHPALQDRPEKARLPLAGFLHDLKLHLLDFREALPLLGDEIVNFFVQMPDLEFGL